MKPVIIKQESDSYSNFDSLSASSNETVEVKKAEAFLKLKLPEIDECDIKDEMDVKDHVVWTEKCLQLIATYKQLTIVWNPENPNYYKENLKRNAWNEVGTALDSSASNCKQKMINILALFRRERVKRRQESVMRKRKAYQCGWFAYDTLLFLTNRKQPNMAKMTATKFNLISLMKEKEDYTLSLLEEEKEFLQAAVSGWTHSRENEELKVFCHFI